MQAASYVSLKKLDAADLAAAALGYPAEPHGQPETTLSCSFISGVVDLA
jgi:hypothetical protein